MADDESIAPPVDPPAPTLRDALNWTAEKGDLPEPFAALPLDDIRSTVEAERADAIAAERARLETEHQLRTEREQEQQRHQATLQSDIDWAADLEKRLESEDETVRRSAKLDRQSNEERYARGLASKFDVSAQAVSRQVLDKHYQQLLDGLTPAGFAGFLDKASALIEQNGRNPIVAAIRYGQQLSADEAFTRGKEEGARAERIAQGREGAPPIPGTQIPGSRPPNPSAMDLDEYGKLSPAARNKAWSDYRAWQEANPAAARRA